MWRLHTRQALIWVMDFCFSLLFLLHGSWSRLLFVLSQFYFIRQCVATDGWTWNFAVESENKRCWHKNWRREISFNSKGAFHQQTSKRLQSNLMRSAKNGTGSLYTQLWGLETFRIKRHILGENHWMCLGFMLADVVFQSENERVGPCGGLTPQRGCWWWWGYLPRRTLTSNRSVLIGRARPIGAGQIKSIDLQ